MEQFPSWIRSIFLFVSGAWGNSLSVRVHVYEAG